MEFLFRSLEILFSHCSVLCSTVELRKLTWLLLGSYANLNLNVFWNAVLRIMIWWRSIKITIFSRLLRLSYFIFSHCPLEHQYLYEGFVFNTVNVDNGWSAPGSVHKLRHAHFPWPSFPLVTLGNTTPDLPSLISYRLTNLRLSFRIS